MKRNSANCHSRSTNRALHYIHSRKPMAKLKYFNESAGEMKKEKILFVDMMKENGFMTSHKTSFNLFEKRLKLRSTLWSYHAKNSPSRFSCSWPQETLGQPFVSSIFLFYSDYLGARPVPQVSDRRRSSHCFEKIVAQSIYLFYLCIIFLSFFVVEKIAISYKEN